MKPVMKKITPKTLIQDECNAKNHRGMMAVLSGQRLPCPELGQDAAFAAFQFGSIEKQLRDTQEMLVGYMQECDRLREKLEGKQDGESQKQ